MRKIVVFIVCALCFWGIAQNSSAANKTARIGLSYTYPTNYKNWQDAFVSGNGKIGILVFGNPLNETVIYNNREFSMAKTHDRSFAQVSKADLDSIKKFCAQGRFKEANEIAVRTSEWKDGGEGNRHPGFKMAINIPQDGEITNYSRVCNFETGEISVKWKDNRGNWERKSFVSRKDNIIVQSLTAPSKGKLTCSIELGVEKDMLLAKSMQFEKETTRDYLVFRAKYPANTGGAGYEGVIRVEVVGGTKSIEGDVLHIKDANSVIMITRAEKYYRDCEQQWNKQEVQRDLKNYPADYKKLLAGQLATHTKIYNRVNLDFGASAAERALSNEELLAKQKETKLPVLALWERIFDSGRYSFLSSSSDQTPPDLLGIWTGDTNAGWGGYYHLDANLNIQVSGGNVGNMPEAMEGYFHLNEVWANDFRINAQKLLGCRGLLASGNTPGITSGLMAKISDFYPYQYATGEEAWLLYPFWEHYLVTGDTDFLRNRLYPLLKEMGHFYEDFLVYTDAQGKYIFAGSVSPEIQSPGVGASLVNNSNFDISGAKFILTALIEASNILSLEQGAGAGVEKWSKILDKLPPYMINSDGGLQEWAWPGLKDSYSHRHSSHLLMMWPYREITKENNTAIFNAIANTLERKDKNKYENAGHGYLVSAFVASGLKNSRAVYNKLHYLMSDDYYYNSLMSSHNNKFGVYCADVCNTVPGLMMDMLVHSNPGVLELLPSLPEELSKGSVSGIKGRNRVTVENLSWDLNKKSLKCILKSDIDQSITLIERQGIKRINAKTTVEKSLLGNIARTVTLPKGKNIAIEIGW
ncbi:glycosyl hydrolase family 95 catalytic domain-containing protein [Viscerimonas tarda]